MQFLRGSSSTALLNSGIKIAFAFCLLFGEESRSDEQIYVTPADNSSPRATMESFIRISNQIYEAIQDHIESGTEVPHADSAVMVDELLRSLDLSDQPEFLMDSFGKEGAVCIKEILDRVKGPPMSQIPGPDDLEAESESGLLERWRVPGTVLVIHRITEGERTGDYLFSAESVAKAVKNYELYYSFPYRSAEPSRDFYAWYLTHPGPVMRPLVEKLPLSSRTRLINRQALWQWVALAVVLVVSLVVIFLAYYVGRKIGERRKKTSAMGYAITLFYPILAMLVPAVFLIIVKDHIRISGAPLVILSFSANVVMLFAAMVVISGLGSRVAEFIISRPSIPEKGIDAQLIRIISKVVSMALAVMVFLEGGKYLGIPLSTLLASAGVGGLAFALAAQESLKNFFGSLMIYMDKPFRIGERIEVKGYDGIVEEVGIRSTRLRLLNGHQATLPNEQMASTDIENVSRRPHIRRKADLKLPIDTSADQMEKALEIVRTILKNHEGMHEDFPPRVHFTEIDTDSLNLRFLYWYHPPVYWEFLEFSERINFQIMREFEAAGLTLDVPVRLRQTDSNGLEKPQDS